MPSIKEVAAEAKVSLGTVSKVLNGRNDATITKATRERIHAAARQVGYHPSIVARGLAGKRMNALGVVMAYSQESVTSDPYLGPCLDGILSVCKQRHQKTILYLEGSWDDALESVPMYCDGHCDGLLLVIPRTNCGITETLLTRPNGIPFVLVGDSRNGDELVAADVDNVGGARAITEYLLQLGHRRIAVFCGNYDFCSNDQRIEGYRQALAAAGIPFDPELLFPGEYHPEWGERNVAALLRRFPGETLPTAVFCLCDAIAVGALRAFAANHLSVPGRISVVGFDDIATAEMLGLTTMRHPIRTVGMRATEALLGCIHKEVSAGRRDLIPPELTVRATTAPPGRNGTR
ncbi:MAG: LacI family DNA-binding transcriptional regulator [Capsulimonadales bacterium]|nr:LacI family DNA-binding transcriptional regulator [Capsulimonadales bacterium]